MQPPKPKTLQPITKNSNFLNRHPIRRTQIDGGGLIALDAGHRIVLDDEELGEFRVLEAATARLGGRWGEGGEEDIRVDKQDTACGVLLGGRHGGDVVGSVVRWVGMLVRVIEVGSGFWWVVVRF